RRPWALAAALIGALGALATWGARGRSGADPERIRREAEADLRGGRYERAAAALATLRDPWPRDRLAKAEEARGPGGPHHGRGDGEEAIAELAGIPDGDPVAARARLMAGQIEVRRDRIRRGEEALRAALKLDPTLVPAHQLLIYVDGMLLRRGALNEHFNAL